MKKSLPLRSCKQRGFRFASRLLFAALFQLSLLPAVFGQTAPQFDFGDAPRTYPQAVHSILKGFSLGATVDAESGSLFSANADGDDLTPTAGPDDEDGVTFLDPLIPGQTVQVQVVASLVDGGALDAWIDFDGNSDWIGAGEQIFTAKTLANGTNNLTFAVPATATPNITTFARFRISFAGGLPPGPLPNQAIPTGEVEDYQVSIKAPAPPLDFGDAPQKYQTLLADDGARHEIVQGLMLGKLIDAEKDGQPSIGADGDDLNPPTGLDDEDGVTFLTALKAGSSATVQVVTSIAQSRLDAWIDFNGDGDWADPGEQIFTSLFLTAQTNNLTFNVPADAVAGGTYARFRLSFEGGLKPNGLARSGEVEDYAVTIQVDQIDFGDAPDSPNGPFYPTLLARDGARHIIVKGFNLGQRVDAEKDGQPSVNADGDDITPAGVPSDEDGVSFITNPLRAGSAAVIQVTASAPRGLLDAWIDFNGNGNWSDAGEQIFTSTVLNAGPNNLTFTVPAAATLGQTYARFRFSSKGGLKPNGLAADGEVEDYFVKIDRPLMDYGDAPQSYPVTFVQDGARHTVLRGYSLGQITDEEPDGFPSSGADGDDLNPSSTGPDDEDGVFFQSGGLIPGQTATVQVVAVIPAGISGRLDAWVDFNRDGDWADIGEKILNATLLVSGTNNLTFLVPSDAAPGTTFSRFRMSLQGGLSFTGAGGQGEVEDHPVQIQQIDFDFGDAPDTAAAPGYPTLLAHNGARHQIVKSVNLGRNIDAEKDGQPSVAADGDDITPAGAADDEDGVQFTTALIPGQTAQVEVVASVQGMLDAWIDYAGNGNWTDAGDQIFSSQSLNPGTNALSFVVPATAKVGNSYGRFRFSLRGGLKPDGPAPDGEVEDYTLKIENELLDFGDAPDGFTAPGYPTLLANDGARHRILKGFNLGRLIDGEADGQPNTGANGDDINPANSDDEDGVRFIGPLQAGDTAYVEVTLSAGVGRLDAWIDFNMNKSWNDAGEQIFTSQALVAGPNVLSFAVPANVKISSDSYARFRLSRQGGLKPNGLAPDGEVEDYLVRFVNRPDVPCVDRTHRGTNFWITFPGNYAPDPDNPVNLRLYILGVRNTSVSVTIPGLGFSSNFVMTSSEKIMALPKAAELGNANDIIEKKGINITASAEVTVYGINKVKYTTDGYLALPADVVGRRYIIQGYGNEFANVPDLNGTQFAIVGTQDGTSLSITPNFATLGHAAGVPYPIVLNQGETYQLRNTNDFNNDLTGTLVAADKPISVFGSHQTANVPSRNVFFADHVVEQLLSIERAGSYFLSVPLATRTGDTFRFTATQDNTTVRVNGVFVATLNKGEFHERTLFGASRITAEKPIFVAQYANSSDFDHVVNSDPFMMVVPPISMYLNQYLVEAPDLGFVEHYVNLAAPNGVVGSLTLDGVTLPAVQFTAIGGTAYSSARVKVAPGVHTVSAAQPFGIWIYGWAEYESYGYPGGLFFGDTEPPRLTCPQDTINVTLGAAGTTFSCNTTVPDLRQGVQATDNCGLSPQFVVSQDPPPGTVVGSGKHIITLSTFDAQGNYGFCEVTFNVIDPTPLQLLCPKDMLVRCNTEGGAFVDFRVLARRQCGPVDEPVVQTVPASGSFFPEGTNVVNCTVTDPGNGQVLTCSFNVIVTCTAEPPSITTVKNVNNTLTLSWSGGAVLETTTALGQSWTPVDTDNQSSFTVTPTGKSGFYRLRVP